MTTPAARPPVTPARGRLRVLASSDLHAQIWPHDYDRDRPTTGIGLARLATTIRRARAECAASILLDNGDLLQGTQMADHLASGRAAGAHPLFAAMNALGYDAATLGNHDFNYGLEVLNRWLGCADFPYVCANVLRRRGAAPQEDTPFLPPYTILSRDIALEDGRVVPIRVAVIGATPPQIMIWDRDMLAGQLEVRGMLPALRHWANHARGAGADLVIALCHSGIGTPTPHDEDEDCALGIAALPEVDAVICGHSHGRLPGTDYLGLPGVSARLGRLAGTPAVMPGSLGSDLGVIDLELTRDTDRGWQVADAKVALRPVGDTPAARDILALTRRDHLQTRRASRTSLAQLRAPLSGLFPLACPAGTLQIVADAQMWRAAAMPGVQKAGLPLLSAVAPFQAGEAGGAVAFTYLPAGPLRRGHLAELAPFPDAVTVLEIDGQILRLWLERGVAGYARLSAGDRDIALTYAEAASYNFEQIHGVTYEIDLTRRGWFAPDGTSHPRTRGDARIRNLRFQGQPVRASDRFAAATNTFRAGGGGRFPALAECPRLGTAPERLRDTLGAYVHATGPLPLPLRAFWHFTPVDAVVTVRSAPWARAEHAAGSGRRIERVGQSGSGHGLFRLDLGTRTPPLKPRAHTAT
ncbi:MAG: 5'-nucleotidase C-terminal domain-containing protein [Qingshengfaniella sp.]